MSNNVLTFIPFPKFPPEIRIKIWGFASQNYPRDILIDVVETKEQQDGVTEDENSDSNTSNATGSNESSDDSEIGSFRSGLGSEINVKFRFRINTTNPTVLRVNRESRHEALKQYTTCFNAIDEGTRLNFHVYMNPCTDVLFIRMSGDVSTNIAEHGARWLNKGLCQNWIPSRSVSQNIPLETVTRFLSPKMSMRQDEQFLAARLYVVVDEQNYVVIHLANFSRLDLLSSDDSSDAFMAKLNTVGQYLGAVEDQYVRYIATTCSDEVRDELFVAR